MASRINGCLVLIVAGALIMGATAQTKSLNENKVGDSFLFNLPPNTSKSLNEYEVGDNFGWNLPPNTSFFSDWASNKTFFIGDSLVFISNNNETHNVVEVSTQAEYDSCTKPGVVYSTSAPLTITLNNSGPRYFLCTVDNHCEAGMKFAIDVSTVPGSPDVGASSFTAIGSLVVVFFTTAISFLAFV